MINRKIEELSMAPPLYHKIIQFQFSIQNNMVFHISGFKPTVFICNFIHFKFFNTCIVKISSCHAKIFDIFLCFNLMILFICKGFFNFLHCCIISSETIPSKIILSASSLGGIQHHPYHPVRL